MIAADRRVLIERSDNGWVLDYWTRERSAMTHCREVFTGYLRLLQRLSEVLGQTGEPLPVMDDGA